MSGQAPPSSISDYLNTNMSPYPNVKNDPINPPEFDPYVDTSSVSITSTVTNSPTYSIPQPTRCPNKTIILYLNFFMIMPTHLKKPLKFQARIPTHQYNPPFKIEKTFKNEEYDEMAKKMKSSEQIIRYIQGLGGHK